MKQYYDVVDTNVLVSALLATLKDKESSPLKILHHILDGAIIPIFNDEILMNIGRSSIVLNSGFPRTLLNRF